MSESDRTPHRLDKGQPNTTPFLARPSLGRQPVTFSPQRPLMSAMQRALLYFLSGLVLLGVLGWFAGLRICTDWDSKPQSQPELTLTQLPTTSSTKPRTASTTIKSKAPATVTPQTSIAATPIPSLTPAPAASKQANPTPVMSDSGHLALQTGSYQDEGEATKQIARLKDLGFKARKITITIPNKGRWYRIQIGRFESRETAIRLGQQLQLQKVVTAFIVTEYAVPSS